MGSIEFCITKERVDEIPLLLAHLERTGIRPLLDEHLPTHGNWVGLSLGWIITLWCPHIPHKGDHRLNRVASWAKQRLHPLRNGTDPLDVSDDWWANVLEALSDH